MAARDPYSVLGISKDAPAEEVRRAYHRLVQIHHPDHNGGSAESARRFEEIQAAYAQIRSGQSPPSGASAGRAAEGAAGDPEDLEARIAALEHELREAQRAKAEAERARAAARRAAREAAGNDRRRATDDELGYVHTDDSFSSILADALDQLSGRLSEAREHPASKRAGELVDELEQLLRRHRPRD